MFPEILALLIGILVGTITGLFPGIHINLIASALTSSLALFSSFPPIVLVIFIISISITHTFLDFIPSILLGAPNEENFLSVLPGHKLLNEGKGYEAIILTLQGSLIAIPLLLILTPLLLLSLPSISELIKPIIPFLLILLSIYMIFREENFIASLTIFILAGFLGYLTLNLPVKEPLLPLLSGLFGASSILLSLNNKISLPKQEIKKIKNIFLTKKEIIKSSIAASLTAPLVAFLPVFGSGQAATISSEFSETPPKSFLFLIGIINTLAMSFSFIALYSINKTRTGSAVAVKEILNKITFNHLLTIIIAIVISGIISFFWGIFLSKLAVKYINKLSYFALSLTTLIIILLVNLIITNYLGIIILITSTSLGIFCILSNSKRINLMGCLLIPTILFYLSF